MVDDVDVPDQSCSNTVRDHDSTDTAGLSGDEYTGEMHSQQDSGDGHGISRERDIHEPASSQGELASETVSVHSMPIVLVTEPQPTPRRRSSSSSLLIDAPSVEPPSLLSPGRPQSAPSDNPQLPQQRRDRHRSAIEVRMTILLLLHYYSVYDHVSRTVSFGPDIGLF